MASPDRPWLLPAIAAGVRIGAALIVLSVGLHLDHAGLEAGSMTWLGAGLLVALAIPDAQRARRAWLAAGGEALLPEVQMALQLQTLTARIGPTAAALAVEQAARTRAVEQARLASAPETGGSYAQHD